MEQLRNQMIQNVCAYNKHQDKKYLQQKDNDYLLANCHPTDRELIREKIKKITPKS